MSVTTNSTIDPGGSNEMTIYDTIIRENRTKTLVAVDPPQTTSNRSAGPKDTFFVDLLRIRFIFDIEGHIDEGDISKLRSVFNAGGTTTMTIEGTNYTGIIEKFERWRDAVREDDHFRIKFNFIVGVDFGS